LRAIAFVAFLAVSMHALADEPPVRVDPATYPGKTWQHITNPGALGWSPSALERLRKALEGTQANSMLVVYSGKVLFAYGDVHKPLVIASVRKSILSALYGNYVASGKIRLDATLADLGIDDVGGLSAKEKQATVRDLLRARSGVYHPAANKGDDSASAPPRGSQEHGAYFLYNNWDFNALGTIFEQQTGQDIYDAFQHDIAGPVQMEDFRRSEQHKERNDRLSVHPAYHFHMTSSDLVRFGYLMLRGGNWNGKQLVPAAWVAESTRVSTRVMDMHPDRLHSGPVGYGYLWWPWDWPWAQGPFTGAYTGHGYGGQFITELPALDLVVALNTPQHASHPVRLWDYLMLLDILVSARCDASPCP
jgi:CubicO group peptidase (beta-lactamase class C family)